MKTKLLLLLFLCTSNAFAQSGEPDPTFGTNGKVITGMGSNSNFANAVALQPDGKIIVGGTYISSHGDNDFALMRYNANGSADASFSSDGKTVTAFGNSNNNYIHWLYILPNGKILAYGSTGTQSLTPKSAIVRYNSNGSIDTSFGTEGKIISDLFPYNTIGNKLAIQPDGKLVITSIKLYSGDANYYLAVERYTENGQPDLTFGSNGLATASFGTGRSIPFSILVQPDGKILVSATYYQSSVINMGLMRFNADGTLDTGFDGDGKVTTSFGAGTGSEGMQAYVTNTGKIILAGSVTTATVRNFGVVQYNANGSIDTTFDGDGKATAALPNELDYSLINNITWQADGKFLVVFRNTDYASSASDFVLRRYNSNITPDTGFGTNGRLQATIDTGLNEAKMAAVTTNGDILVAGSARPAGNAYNNFVLAKYNNAGSPVMAFGNNGKAAAAFEKSNDRIKKLLVLPNDKMIAVGTSSYRKANNTFISDIAIARYNVDGTPDVSFGSSGKVLSNDGERRNTVATAALQQDGKVVVSNSNVLGNILTYEIIRYNADGSRDTAFANSGSITLPFLITALLCQPDGKIIAAGDNGTLMIVNRYNSNGTPDAGFSGDGNTIISIANNYWGMATLALQPDGKIILSNTVIPAEFNASPQFGTVRLNTDGSLDTTFGNNGKILTQLGDVSFANASFVQPDGKIVVAGRSVTTGVNFSSVRYTANGVIDIAYGTNGVASYQLPADYRELNDVYLQADGKLLAVLSKYNQPSATYDFRVMRFTIDGMPDGDFGNSGEITTSFYNGYDEAFSVALQLDNRVIVAGSTYSGITEDFALARFTNTILGREDFESKTSRLVAFPNPVGDTLYISAGYTGQEFSIYDTTGKLLIKGVVTTVGITMAGFSSGVYIVKVGKESVKVVRL